MVSPKSPVVAMLAIDKFAPPVFDSVTGCAVLVLPTFVLAKVRLLEERLAAEGEAPAPVAPTEPPHPTANAVRQRAERAAPRFTGPLPVHENPCPY